MAWTGRYTGQMVKKTTIAIAAAAAVLVIGGGVGIATAANLASSDETSSSQTPTATSTDEQTGSATPEPTETAGTEDPTAAGEVCDPSNLNDAICAAFYPDIAVINMTAGPRSGEPLASMSTEQRIALAHQACDQLEAGADPHSINLVETSADDIAKARDNNYTLYSAGSLAYCESHIATDDFGAKLHYALDAYRAMGEEAAKKSFAGGVVIRP